MAKKQKELIVVGIGASAGGLEALQGLVKNLPKNTNIAYLLAQHLSPTYKSMMVDLLAKDSTIKIKEAKNQEIIEADTMYISPPNKNIIIEGDQILIIDPKQLTYGPKPSINILFESIAANKGSKSIGVILSGTGSDGSRGIRAIKAEGGFTIVQQPQNAKYDGMPNSAINTGNIDLILDVEVIGNEIVEILKYPDKAESLNNINEKTLVYRNILAKLQRSKKIDFSLYKSSTIQRRIERRMAALKVTNLNDYYEYLIKHDNNEVEELFKDILIGVTSFFRDEEAFLALKLQISEQLLKKEDKNIRIWIPGCSTGEEAYTIAMIISEILGSEVAEYKVQIFATDIDEEATKFARAARYPESTLINVEKSYIKKYFTIKNDEYEIIKPIRDMCIFSRHDITNDPAFMRLDLISCRNLLIYFTAELQQRLFPMFHYSLNDDGILFLGKSESIGNFNHQFKIIDKKWKLYRAMYLGQKTAPQPLRTFDPSKDYQDHTSSRKHTSNTPTISDMMVEHIQRHLMPMCVVINDSFDLVFIKGNNPYLIRPEGEISQNIFKNVKNEISVELRAGIHECKKDGNLIKTQYQKVYVENEFRFVRFIITPLDNALTGNLFLICFQEESAENLQAYGIVDKENTSNEEIDRLQLELTKTKEHLQTVIEELETSNEEMQSLNEELQSSNEELQSSNEELETTNEELQSTNEELQTAYTEMRAMFEERDKDAIRINEIREELELSTNRLSLVLSSQNIGVFDIDLVHNKTCFVNEKWCQILGFNKDEIESKMSNLEEWFKSRIHPKHLEKRQEKFESLLLGKIDTYKIELQVLNKQNEYIWVKCFNLSLKDEKTKKVTRILGTLSEIEKTRKQELEHKITQTKLKEIVKASRMGTWEYDLKNDKLWCNENLYEILEVDENESLTLELIESLMVDKNLDSLKSKIEKAIEDKTSLDVDFKIETNNNAKHLFVKGDVICDDSSEQVKLVGIVQEIK